MTGHDEGTPADAASAPDAARSPQLSKRAKRAQKEANPAFEAVLAALFGDQYSPTNPNGLINAGVAENSLMFDWFIEHYKKHLELSPADLTYGDALAGSKRLYKALSHLFNKHFHAIKPVTDDHLICGVGVSAVLDQLCDKICDVDDGILIAEPYYNGFDNDLAARSLVKPIGVSLPDDMDPASPRALEHFETKLAQLKKEGQNVSALIMCNPNNPLGFIYPKETLLAYCRFCEKHNLHLISDEIYALSLYKNRNFTEQPGFQSILAIDVEKEAGCNPARVHVLYGMSKDFGSNGLRVGVLVSQHNPALIKSFGMSAILMKVSSPADALWSSILGDEKLLEWYIDEAQSRASSANAYALDWLDKMGIPHSNPIAGHFIWINLNAFLPKKDKDGKTLKTAAEQEYELFSRLLFKHNVYVPGGAFYHSPQPGFFRLTFTLRRDYMEEAFKRIEDGLNAVKRENEAR